MSLKIEIPSFKRHLLFWLITLTGAAADLWSKYAVFALLEEKPDNQISVIGNFLSFIMRENPGAAFSIAQGQRVFLVSVSLIAFLAIVAAFESGFFKDKFNTVIAAMFAAGICGNLYDRLFNDGMVRDFIDVNLYIANYHWPTFNIADSLLTISLGMYIVKGVAEERKAKNEKS